MIKTRDGKTIAVEKLNWKEARDLLKSVCPEIVTLIDRLDDDCTEYPFYKASYPFGSRIIRGSDVYLPLAAGNTISFNDPTLPQELIEDLGYDPKSSNPLGIILSKNSELYLPQTERIMPYMVISPGDMFGLARVLDNVIREDPTQPSNLSFSTYNLNAGVRSIFMLAKVSDKISHSKLKKAYNFEVEAPKSYMEHWAVFREIARKTGSPWRSEVLYFSNKWIKKLNAPAWATVFAYLGRKYRTSNPIWHNIQGWEATFSKIETAKYLEYFSAYTLDTAKHLFTIAANSAPGFRPAMDENSAPIKIIQEAYVKHYNLTEYWPIIMEPAQFALSPNEPLYYSLSYATLAQFNPQKFKGKTIISLESEVQRCAKQYQEGILAGNNNSQFKSLYNAAAKVNFTFYHNEPRDYSNILDSTCLPEEDKRFVFDQPGTFPSASTFLVGCVKITPHSQEEESN